MSTQKSSKATEVSLALQDFFIDKEKKTKVELNPHATKLAWCIMRLTGTVGFEDLDQIYKNCPKESDFANFVTRALAVEKRLGPNSVACLSSLEDLKAAEQMKAQNTPEM